MSFVEYPKAMKHPQHRAAVISKDEIINGKIIKAAPGQPERFPDVFVNNEDQEKQYASLGYVPNGTSDPEAYRRAMAGADEPAGHQHHDYPRWMYQPNESGEMEVAVNHEPVKVRGVVVKNEAEREALRGEWFETPREAAEATLDDEGEEQEAQGGESKAEPAKRGAGRQRNKPEVA